MFSSNKFIFSDTVLLILKLVIKLKKLKHFLGIEDFEEFIIESIFRLVVWV